MTPRRFFVVFVPGVIVLVALLLPLVEVAMDLRGASLILAVAGTLTVIGGAMAVWGAIRNNAEQVELVVGRRDAFVQLMPYRDPRQGWFISTFHRGGGNIYDVQVVIREITEDGSQVFEVGERAPARFRFDRVVL